MRGKRRSFDRILVLRNKTGPEYPPLTTITRWLHESYQHDARETGLEHVQENATRIAGTNGRMASVSKTKRQKGSREREPLLCQLGVNVSYSS